MTANTPAWSRPTPRIGDATTAAERAVTPHGWAFDPDHVAAFDAVVRGRRDVRKFRPTPLPGRVVEAILAAGHAAPSVGHSQPWRFVVVQDQTTRDKAAWLADRARLRQAAQMAPESARGLLDLKLEGIREAPVGVVVCCDRRTPAAGVLGRHTFTDADMWSCACAIQNMWLAARARGVGMGWVTLFDPADLTGLVAAPEGVETLGWLCFGYPDERPPAPGLERAGWSRRQPLTTVISHETFDESVSPPPNHEAPAPTGDAAATRQTTARQQVVTRPGDNAAHTCGASRHLGEDAMPQDPHRHYRPTGYEVTPTQLSQRTGQGGRWGVETGDTPAVPVPPLLVPEDDTTGLPVVTPDLPGYGTDDPAAPHDPSQPPGGHRPGVGDADQRSTLGEWPGVSAEADAPASEVPATPEPGAQAGSPDAWVPPSSGHYAPAPVRRRMNSRHASGRSSLPDHDQPGAGQQPASGQATPRGLGPDEHSAGEQTGRHGQVYHHEQSGGDTPMPTPSAADDEAAQFADRSRSGDEPYGIEHRHQPGTEAATPPRYPDPHSQPRWGAPWPHRGEASSRRPHEVATPEPLAQPSPGSLTEPTSATPGGDATQGVPWTAPQPGASDRESQRWGSTGQGALLGDASGQQDLQTGTSQQYTPSERAAQWSNPHVAVSPHEAARPGDSVAEQRRYGRTDNADPAEMATRSGAGSSHRMYRPVSGLRSQSLTAGADTARLPSPDDLAQDGSGDATHSGLAPIARDERPALAEATTPGLAAPSARGSDTSKDAPPVGAPDPVGRDASSTPAPGNSAEHNDREAAWRHLTAPVERAAASKPAGDTARHGIADSSQGEPCTGGGLPPAEGPDEPGTEVSGPSVSMHADVSEDGVADAGDAGSRDAGSDASRGITGPGVVGPATGSGALTSGSDGPGTTGPDGDYCAASSDGPSTEGTGVADRRSGGLCSGDAGKDGPGAPNVAGPDSKNPESSSRSSRASDSINRGSGESGSGPGESAASVSDGADASSDTASRIRLGADRVGSGPSVVSPTDTADAAQCSSVRVAPPDSDAPGGANAAHRDADVRCTPNQQGDPSEGSSAHDEAPNRFDGRAKHDRMAHPDGPGQHADPNHAANDNEDNSADDGDHGAGDDGDKAVPAPVPATVVVAARDQAATVPTPAGSLGFLDRAIDKVIAALGAPLRELPEAHVVVAAGDHQVADLGVTAYNRSVTADVVAAGEHGVSCGARAAKAAGLTFHMVDCGTSDGDLVTSDALTRGQFDDLVEAGAHWGRDRGGQIVALGEVGMGNTTVGAALAAALLRVAPGRVVGLGADADADMLRRKEEVVTAAVQRLPVDAEPADIVMAVGGPEVAYLLGVTLSVAAAGGVIVADGLVSSVAVLAACRHNPAVVHRVIAGQRSRERGHNLVLAELGLEPLLDLRLRSGEGIGATMAAQLLLTGLHIRLPPAR